MAKQSFSVSQLTPEDKKDWRRLWKGYVPDRYMADILRHNWQALMGKDERLLGLALRLSGQCVGFALYNFHHHTKSLRQECYINDLYVDPEFRGHGGGRILIETILEECLRRRAFRLWWVTPKKNAKAQLLYKKFAKGEDFKRYIVKLPTHRGASASPRQRPSA